MQVSLMPWMIVMKQTFVIDIDDHWTDSDDDCHYHLPNGVNSVSNSIAIVN